MIDRDIFEDLFVLELANNHWGDLQRGLRIVKEFSTVVRYNDVRAAIKLQFRDVENFVHPAWRERQDVRYIKKTLDTRLTRDELSQLVEAVRRNNCIRMATPFDEASVDLCEDLGIEIIKIASSDITDWPLLEKIARTRKPVIVSTGGASIRSMDAMVTFFENRHIPLAINHCVSLYPSEDSDLELNQIDFLKRRYPEITIGFSTHEYHDWSSSIMMAYAKGARTFERHIDIHTDDRPFAPYNSTPEQIAEWFCAFHKAKEMCGGSATERRRLPRKEIEYLDGLVRGVYAKRDLPPGHALTDDDFYLAIPLQKGQLSSRELISGDVLVNPIQKDAPITIHAFDNPYARPGRLHEVIAQRGIDPPSGADDIASPTEAPARTHSGSGRP
jgi:N-acetylneuraminate synthase